MNLKSPDNLSASLNADKKTANSLAELLDARSHEYLQRCLETSTSAERHTVWSRLYTVAQRLKLAVLAGGQDSVADAVLEIGSNLLACEEMAVLELNREYNSISVVTFVGLTPS